MPNYLKLQLRNKPEDPEQLIDLEILKMKPFYPNQKLEFVHALNQGITRILGMNECTTIDLVTNVDSTTKLIVPAVYLGSHPDNYGTISYWLYGDNIKNYTIASTWNGNLDINDKFLLNGDDADSLDVHPAIIKKAEEVLRFGGVIY